ncbi:hypothetical protein Aperf_G00000012496 [Anoplocephala perfoliata]
MLWPTEASFRNTTNSNVNDGGDVQPKIYLKQDVDFGSTREALENHMRNKTKKYCSCGPALFQRKYCSSDFVVIAKKSSVKPQPFYPDPKWADFNYAGLAVPLVVQEVLRGSDALSKNIVVHFIQGSVCGVPSDMIPDGDGAYIIAGFHHTFFRSNPKSDETKKVLLVTKCSISEPLKTLSLTQIAGAFLNLYCRVPSCESRVYFEGSPPSESEKNQACFYPFEARECFSKFTICSKFPPKAEVCEAKAINRLHPTPRILEEIPSELHEKVKESHTSKVNDEQRFRNCLMHVGESIPLYTPRPPVTSAALSSRRNSSPYAFLCQGVGNTAQSDELSVYPPPSMIPSFSTAPSIQV